MSTAGSRILRFLSLGTGGEEIGATPPTATPATSPTAALSLIDHANARLMQEIAEFLLKSRLPISAQNLLLAHAAFSGEDPQLARKIGQKRLAGETITQEWLNTLLTKENEAEAIKAMMVQFEDSLGRFAKTAHDARMSAAHCNAALEKEVTRASETPETFDPEDLIELGRTILDHNRKLETDIRASESEVRTLRTRLSRAQRDAEVDYLTGLPNRRAFDAMFNRIYHETRNAVESLSIAFCDIDHFKAINDSQGHETGDRVIKAVAETLDRLSNQNCHVARHGGEEFVLLFRGMTKHEVREKLDAVRENFSERRFVNRRTDEPIGRITFSGGVADVFAYPSPRDAMRAADEALYLAKEQGRNSIMAAP